MNILSSYVEVDFVGTYDGVGTAKMNYSKTRVHALSVEHAVGLVRQEFPDAKITGARLCDGRVLTIIDPSLLVRA